MYEAALRERAKAKRELAAALRRFAPSLGLADHRKLVAVQATELEADASSLDAEADRAEGHRC